MQGPETRDIVIPSCKKHYKEKFKFMEPNAATMFREGKHFSYNVHDWKMMVCLYGNCYWNLHEGCHIFCSCKKGDAVRNIEKHGKHACENTLDEKQLQCHIRAVKYLQAMKTKKGWKKASEAVQIKQLRKWASKNNLGITGLGIHPKYLKYSNGRADCFHMSCYAEKKLLK